jgi:hypothetical protein
MLILKVLRGGFLASVDSKEVKSEFVAGSESKKRAARNAEIYLKISVSHSQRSSSKT